MSPTEQRARAMEESWIQHLIPDGPHCSHFGLSGNLNHTRQTKLSSFQQAASVAASNLEEAMASSSSLSLFSYFTSFFLWHPQWHFSYYWQANSAAAATSVRAAQPRPRLFRAAGPTEYMEMIAKNVECNSLAHFLWYWLLLSYYLCNSNQIWTGTAGL